MLKALRLVVLGAALGRCADEYTAEVQTLEVDIGGAQHVLRFPSAENRTAVALDFVRKFRVRDDSGSCGDDERCIARLIVAQVAAGAAGLEPPGFRGRTS